MTDPYRITLRYAFARGAQEAGRASYAAGIEKQRESVLEALGAAPKKEQALP